MFRFRLLGWFAFTITVIVGTFLKDAYSEHALGPRSVASLHPPRFQSGAEAPGSSVELGPGSPGAGLWVFGVERRA